MANNNWYVKITASGGVGVVELNEANGREKAWKNEIWCESIEFLVGGVADLDFDCVMIVDAEGKFNAGQDLNKLASDLFGSARFEKWIYGDALIGRIKSHHIHGDEVVGLEEHVALEFAEELYERIKSKKR